MFEYKITDFRGNVSSAEVCKIVGYIPYYRPIICWWKKPTNLQIVDVETPNSIPMFVCKIILNGLNMPRKDVYILSNDEATKIWGVKCKKPLSFIDIQLNRDDRARIRKGISYYIGSVPLTCTSEII